MSVIADVLIGLAASLLFFLMEPYLLGLGQSWKLLSAAAVLVAAGVIANLIRRSSQGRHDEPRNILGGNKAGQGLAIVAKHIDASAGHGDVLSHNKAKGNVTINISDSKL